MRKPWMPPLTPIRSDLVGKGGVGLAMFHLARLGFEFVATTGHSANGDLWVRFGDAPEAVEVKTTRGGSWNLRPDQLSRVSRVVFVDMDDGSCWMAHAKDIATFCSTRKSMCFHWRHMDAIKAEAWHKAMPKVCPPKRAKATPVTPGALGNRRVRKTLADGTVRVYEYASLQRANKTQTDHASS